MDDLTSLTDSYLEAKVVISLGRNPFPAALLSDLPDLALVRRAQVPRALIGRPPSPQPRALARRAQVPRALTSHQGPGGAALGPALDHVPGMCAVLMCN